MRRAAALGLTAALALALVGATAGLPGPRALAFLLQAEALLVGLAGPWLAARVLEDGDLARGAARGLLHLLLGGAVVTVASLARGGDAVAVALAQVYLGLVGAGLFALTVATGTGRPVRGLVVGLGAAALGLGFPWLGGDLVAALPVEAEASAVSWLVVACPAVAASGTFAGIDVFRGAVLYDRFRAVQDVGVQYASPARAVAFQAVLAALCAGAAFVARRLPRKAGGAAAALALTLVLGAPSRAEAQMLGGGADSPPAPEGEIGPMGTKVRLGYVVPFLDGHFRVASPPPRFATEFDLQRDLDLHLAYAVPTFELELGWKGAGRVWAEYWEAQYHGSFLSPQPAEATFRNLVVPATEVAAVEYRFRTVAVRGAVEIPILDWVTLSLVGTTRYVHWFTKVRAPRQFQRQEANFDGIAPGIGPGVDVFITDKVYVYGDIAWLDFSLGGLLGDKKGPEIHYREGHAGVRLELIEHAHVGVELYFLEVGIEDGRYDYRQRILGPRIWVEIQF